MKSLLLSAFLFVSLIGDSYGAAINITPRSPIPNPLLDSRQCPRYQTIAHSFQPDDTVFSRAVTTQLQNQLNEVTSAAEVCALILGIATAEVGGEGAIPCALFAIETNFFANKAGECSGKNQCLKMKWKTIPECDGGSHCC